MCFVQVLNPWLLQGDVIHFHNPSLFLEDLDPQTEKLGCSKTWLLHSTMVCSHLQSSSHWIIWFAYVFAWCGFVPVTWREVLEDYESFIANHDWQMTVKHSSYLGKIHLNCQHTTYREHASYVKRNLYHEIYIISETSIMLDKPDILSKAGICSRQP